LEEVDGRRQSLVRSSSGPECKKIPQQRYFYESC
jgi:hypothetical protein